MASPDAPSQEIDPPQEQAVESTQARTKSYSESSALSQVFAPSKSTSISSAPSQADSIRASPPAKPARCPVTPKFPRARFRQQKKVSAPEQPASAPANRSNAIVP